MYIVARGREKWFPNVSDMNSNIWVCMLRICKYITISYKLVANRQLLLYYYVMLCYVMRTSKCNFKFTTIQWTRFGLVCLLVNDAINLAFSNNNNNKNFSNIFNADNPQQNGSCETNMWVNCRFIVQSARWLFSARRKHSTLDVLRAWLFQWYTPAATCWINYNTQWEAYTQTTKNICIYWWWTARTRRGIRRALWLRRIIKLMH